MRFRLGRFSLVVAALAMALAAPSSTEAGLLTVNIEQTAGTSGPDSLTVEDGDSNDSDALTNAIDVNIAVGDFTIASSVEGTSNNPGDSSSAFLTVRTLQIRNTSTDAATLVITLSQTGFTMPGGPTSTLDLRTTFTGSYSKASPGDTVSSIGAADPGNALYATTDAAATQTGAATLFGSSLPTSFVINPVDPTTTTTRNGDFSLTKQITITLAAGTTVNLEGIVGVTAVPEPGAIAMAFTALPLLGGLWLRRRNLRRSA